MPIKDVNQLANQMHDAGLLKLDTTIADVLKVQGIGDVDPLSEIASTVIAWDGYVLVYGGKAVGLEQIQTLRPEAPQG